MLEIDTISWRNFISYGDYTTTLKVGDLGQCLITGEVVDSDKEAYDSAAPDQIKKSNGAGKTTIVSVLQWILFGRTSHAANPGDKVVNYFTGKDCFGKITFKNGDSIIRTRNYEGKNELIFVRDGNENSANVDTLSTSKAQQAKLNKLFNLDWDIFCGSTFFSQYGKPWMEMADQPRKKALERLLRVDRFAYYSKVAKAKCEKFDAKILSLNQQKESLLSDTERTTNDIERLKNAAENFTTNQESRQQALLNSADEAIAKRDAISLPDLVKLKTKWDLIAQINEKLAVQQQEAQAIATAANRLDAAISKHGSTADALNRTIRLWHDKGGKVCTSCEQTVPHEHVKDRIEPLEASAENEKALADAAIIQQKELREKYRKMVASIDATKDAIVKKQPAMSMRDANSIHASWKSYDNDAKRLQKAAADILGESNPHNGAIVAAQAQIEKYAESIAKIETEIARYDISNRHCGYIAKAYGDRGKIKSLIFREHIPFINSRLKHYLDVFGLDVKIELTDSLSINSNMWDYEFQSGGERKRTDVAFMMAIFDYHEHKYGRQCNILVMDEVDGRMDDDGIDSLINVIKTDIANRVETLLIISHRQNMKDTFTHEIKVTRKDRFSHLEVI